MKKLEQLEKGTSLLQPKQLNHFKAADFEEVKVLEKKLEHINKQLEDKNRVIVLYANLLNNLRGKIMEKV